MKRFLGPLILLCICVTGNLFAYTDVIDVPTAEVVNYYTMDLNFRLYSGGGVLSRINFGVLKRVNIGGSVDIDKLIGKEAPSIRPPALNLKFRVFDGSQKFPALAVGYSGQGYRYEESSGTYLDREKGLYFVGSIEALTEGLWWHVGTNINFTREDNRDKSNFYAFLGFNYDIEEDNKKMLSFMAEYDNLNDLRNSRLNSGLRFFPAENIHVDLSIKDIASQHGFPTERFLSINYQGNF
ncbi:MAG: hypothetical protein AUJ85_10250 [Elusimicrobia bacterium CG1_02_37_114]|nr:MAG: hypothetical protein AUJ85_10250 [Elusimicrobia bacterium CG1_02_37_114]PIV52425.1 MAG: hypothetical protein COS17_09070 [Elusimicrobia bacterium CG02_land_8_20_14_3_00_37_13]PIZ13164.1 MAG: hypothetical protein COY53_06275 [Elusimicrobia bacterium CG_4_10_14_0_8_um_filter_37_32]